MIWLAEWVSLVILHSVGKHHASMAISTDHFATVGRVVRMPIFTSMPNLRSVWLRASLDRSDFSCHGSCFNPCYPFSSTLSPTPIIPSNPIQRLHHDHRIAANHAHSQPDFLTAGFALCRFVEDDVEEDLGFLSVAIFSSHRKCFPQEGLSGLHHSL